MTTISCHQCGEGFDAVRSDARFCSPRCRKQNSRGTTSKRASVSFTKQREIIERFALNNALVEAYVKTPLKDRPAYIESLIDRAIGGEVQIKQVLTNPYLLGHSAGDNRNVRTPTISKLAHGFTRDTWGVSIHDALSHAA